MSYLKVKLPLLDSSSARPSDKGAAISPVPTKAGDGPQTAPSSLEVNSITPQPTRKVAMMCKARTNESRPSGVENRISPTPTQEKARVAHFEQIKGRIKAPPVCVVPSLKREASSAEDLAAAGVRFSPREAASRAEKALLLLRGGEADCPAGETSPIEGREAGRAKKTQAYYVSSSATVVTISSASSCGQGTMAGDDPPLEVVRTGSSFGLEDELVAGAGQRIQPTGPRTSIAASSEASSAAPSTASFADNLVRTGSSRQGRSLQRWLVQPSAGELVRRAVGTVPITRDGRVVLISAGRKAEWILPKGGWDADETMEECAIRETFEEAGLLGRLGGMMGPLDYEARKARKRGPGGSEGVEVGRGHPEKGDGGDGPRGAKRARTGPPASPDPHPTERLIEVSETSARSIDPKSCSRVRLHLLPLYVTGVRSEWPEAGRLRRMVDVDEAIEIMTRQDRPYFRRGLEIVKERGLHLQEP